MQLYFLRTISFFNTRTTQCQCHCQISRCCSLSFQISWRALCQVFVFCFKKRKKMHCCSERKTAHMGRQKPVFGTHEHQGKMFSSESLKVQEWACIPDIWSKIGFWVWSRSWENVGEQNIAKIAWLEPTKEIFYKGIAENRTVAKDLIVLFLFIHFIFRCVWEGTKL